MLYTTTGRFHFLFFIIITRAVGANLLDIRFSYWVGVVLLDIPEEA